MAFWGEVLKPGQKKAVSFPSATDVLHLSQACLHDPKVGKNYLQVEVNGTTYSIACLEKDKREHDCLDLFFDDERTIFVCKGSSEIHLMGYMEPQRDEEFCEESEEEGQVQQVVPKKASPKAAPVPSPRVAATLAPKTSPKGSPKTAPQAAAAAESDSYEYLEEEEEEEEGRPLDDEGSYWEEGEEEEDIEDVPPVPKLSPKQGIAQSPKRAAAEPAGAPAKKGKTEASGGDEKAVYVKKLHAYLKQNGKTSAGQLGSKVPRPNGLPKMKVVIEENKDKFVMIGDMVTAK